MLPRRLAQHIREQNWFAVTVDFAIVVLGVYCAVWIGGIQDRKELETQQLQVVGALRQDLANVAGLDRTFFAQIDHGLATWAAQAANNEFPPPYFFRIPGSDTPSEQIWSTLQQSQLVNLLHPSLLFDLGLYYSERAGVGRKYVRYVQFVEERILPGLKEDSSIFYRTNETRLKPEFEANMDRLNDWKNESLPLSIWADCLSGRLESPESASESCAPDLSQSRVGPP